MAVWTRHIKDSYFRPDFAYAGRDFTKPNNKTFIAIAPFTNSDGSSDELQGFKTLKAAQSAADKKWPFK